MLFNNKIDIIIPAYNVADEVLFRCLSSIAIQNIRKDLKVTIVDDASTKENYLEVVKNFSLMLDIEILKLEKNGGPGVARQYGIDHTENEFITFIDADDIFATGFAMSTLRTGITENPLYQMAISSFEEIVSENDSISFPHENDLTWMFGKMYRRVFIEKHNIRFHPTSRANEDAGFNGLCSLYINCSNETELINFSPVTTYIWCQSQDSITRKNGCEYGYSGKENSSFHGYVENMINTITTLRNDSYINDTNHHIDIFCYDNMITLYFEYIKSAMFFSEEDEKLFIKWAKKYYQEVYKETEEKNIFNENDLRNAFSASANSQYQSFRMNGVIPHITYYDFLKMIKE